MFFIKLKKSIIGQFGVGFYSIFMVADKVDVYSRRWNEETGIHWQSTGDSGYTIDACDNLPVGTRIELGLVQNQMSLLKFHFDLRFYF